MLWRASPSIRTRYSKLRRAEQMSERFGSSERFSSRRTSLAAKVLEDNSGERDD
jgi:hypothetical protein